MKNSQEIAVQILKVVNKVWQDGSSAKKNNEKELKLWSKALSEAFAQGRVQGIREACDTAFECRSTDTDWDISYWNQACSRVATKIDALIDTRSQADEVDWSGRDVVDADGNPRLIQKNKLVGDMNE